jgi:GTPase SAR1 family protein
LNYCSDCSSRASFDNLSFWLEEVKKYCSTTDAVKVLIANKIDTVCFLFFCNKMLIVLFVISQKSAEVTREEGENFAMRHSMLFVETSARTREGIQHAFEELVLKCLETPNLVNQSSSGFVTRAMKYHFSFMSSYYRTSTSCSWIYKRISFCSWVLMLNYFFF